MSSQHIGLIGATSLVGQLLLPKLVTADCEVFAFTRHHPAGKSGYGVEWQQLGGFSPSPLPSPQRVERGVPFWICVAPIWVLPEHFEFLESQGVRRIIVVSSTSRYGKLGSSDVSEQVLVKKLVDAEDCLKRWADAKKIEWVILRPTLIYGLGRDKNVSEISRFIRRFGFFPLFGKAQGLRQPIHADDVAKACVAALLQHDVSGLAFNLSGGEILPYNEMVERIFKVMGKKPRFFSVPLWMFGFAVGVLRLLPRYKHWSSAMAQRMNQDLVFDHSDARHAFGFEPRGFDLQSEDLPI